MPTRVRSFSKINLGLRVGPPQPGTGFHALMTCYQTLAAHDVITMSAQRAAKTTITLGANHPGVPRTETGDAAKNTAYRLVALALEKLGVGAEVHIELNKRMPVQGGLGAGSANAAAALLGLERELGVALSWDDRLTLAAEVGSDVPMFLLGGTMLGLNRGEEVYPLPDLPTTPCVLAIPSVGVSTAKAFAALDAKYARAQGPGPGDQSAGLPGAGASPLTFQPPVDKLKKLSHALAGAFTYPGTAESGFTGIAGSAGDLAENPLLTLVRTGIENDFEEVAFSEHPTLRSIKHELAGNGPEAAIFAGLSGSGSALFGLYASEQDALKAQQRVQQAGTRAIVTTTLPRTGYWHTMFAE
ncbi:MAG: 4-(cytidine 5'-diphospho)-2-C-methyl-D-erythritol kinase [Acidobacteriaceae bacterium]|nr:4-(cytidine 5'-diphospho)-2-C-methyl-D-erythritol kinase [Acidobacteriaceae bacterium]